MTKTQIKKLVAQLDVDAEVSGRGASWSIQCADRRSSVIVRRALRQAKVYCGGYLCGWGGWVYDNVNRSGYQYTCDFGDKASIHHY